MGLAPGNSRQITGVVFANRNGNARVQRPKNCRSPPEIKTKLLSREPSLQQLVVHIQSCAAPRLGVSNALGEQAHRRG